MLLMIVSAALLTSPSTAGSIKERCVHTCSCVESEDKVDIQCQGLPESQWPGVYPLNTASLDLSGNPLHTVTAFSLQGKGLDHLTSLKLANCELSTIDSEAFRGLRQLTSLELSFNNIKGLKVEHFKDLESLQVLLLRGNDRDTCIRLRTSMKSALPEVTVHCGKKPMKTSPSTTEASLNVHFSSEPSVTPNTSTQTPMTSTPKSTVTANPTPPTPTPSYTETPATLMDTPIASVGGVGSGSAVVIGVVCFLGGALVVALVLFVWPRCQGYKKPRGQEDGEP